MVGMEQIQDKLRGKIEILVTETKISHSSLRI